MWTISTSLAGSRGFSNLFQGFVTASLVVEVALRAIVQGRVCRCLIRCKQPGLKLSSSPGSCAMALGASWPHRHDKPIDMKSKDGRVEIDII